MGLIFLPKKIIIDVSYDIFVEGVMKLNNKGQALVEYLLIIAVISVVVVSLVKLLGGYLQDSMTKTSCKLIDKEYVEGSKQARELANKIIRFIFFLTPQRRFLW